MNKSLWESEVSIPPREALTGSMKTDVAIIGAGLCGILTAYLLKKKGIDCIVLEADRIGSGQTGRTTAKITSQHGLRYGKLIKAFGEEQAKQYAKANQEAITAFRKIVSDLNIECDFTELPAYLYTTTDKDVLCEELAAARRLGIDADLTDIPDLPIKTIAALRFFNQAQFQPLKFLAALAEKVKVFEKTKVIEVKEGEAATEKGSVFANNIVLAVHYPFIITPGYYFLRMHQERSYAIALDNAPNIKGMYIGIEESGLSYRNSGHHLIIAGGNHRAGENTEGGKYEELRHAAQQYFPECTEVAHWSAQDCMPIDGVPYIGLFSKSTPNLYVGTGFQKWGMSTSMAAARVISEMIIGNEHPYPVFSPQRFKLSPSAKALYGEGVHSVKGLSKGFFHIPKETVDSVKNSSGAIVEHNGEKYAVYKDENGKVYAVSPRCTHMGCQLEWNPDELSWDCPCHGSRFDIYGKVIDNPALKDLLAYKYE